MKRLHLFICALVIGGLMWFTPYTAEAFEGDPEVETCTQCHVDKAPVAQVNLGISAENSATTSPASVMATLLGKWPPGSSGNHVIYAIETSIYRPIHYTTSTGVGGFSKVPI